MTHEVRLPKTKVARHAAIARVLANRRITSQAELQDALAELGISTTQATLSRDLFELHATKVFDGEGKPSYTLGGIGVNPVVNGPENGGLTHLAKACQELLVEMDYTGNFVMLRTLAGAAQLMASALDNTLLPDLMGCVGGDDTILVMCRDDDGAERLTSRLLELAEEGAI